MRYAFLGLMCIFAGIYAAVKPGGSFSARLTSKTIASASFVLIAFAGRLDAARPYYSLILAGLCLSLAGDVLLDFPDKRTRVAGKTAFLLAHLGYIAAFFIYAVPAWYDAVLFVVFAALGGVLFTGKLNRAEDWLPLSVTSGLTLCVLAAKALSMLFVSGVNWLYAAFAALGGTLLALSGLMRAQALFHPAEHKTAGVPGVIVYYAAQAMIALSITL